MASSINLRDFLHDLFSNKAKTKLTIDEFDQLMKTANKIQKLSEKGLFVVAMSQQLHKISNVNFTVIKKFMNEFLNGLKPQKVRRERQEGEPRRRRPRQKPSANQGGNINGLVQESVSNPSNLQVVRIGTEPLGPDNQINKLSQNGSRKGEQNKRDIEFADQLNKISEGIEYITNQQLQHNDQADLDEISKASSSSSSRQFFFVSNINQKLDLINPRDQKPQKKTKAVQRTGVKVDATATKKKRNKKLMLDENLTLEKTKETMADTTYDERPISDGFSELISAYQQNQEYFDLTEREFEALIKEKPVSILSTFMLSGRKRERREMRQDIPQELTQFDTGLGEFGETIHDFTSQPMPDFASQQPERSMGIDMSELSIFNYEEANPTLGEISARVNMPEALVFYEMLSKMQKGEIAISQEDVMGFGEIRVELLQN